MTIYDTARPHYLKWRSKVYSPRLACNNCFLQKRKCDKQLPCKSCKNFGKDCSYGGATRKIGRKPTGSRIRSPDRVEEKVSDLLKKEEMDELEQIYFQTVHKSIPILHKSRYGTSKASELRCRPPEYLCHIICAIGALASPKYTTMHDKLYEASRKALEDVELDGSAESILLSQPQAWILIAIYELMQMYFHRCYLSTARAVRFSQMIGLHLVDGIRPSKLMLPVAKDWTETEEQRRTFWMAFVLDRYAAFGYNSLMIIDEEDVHTLLPVDEESYQKCTETQTTTLSQALDADVAANLSPLAAGIVLIARVGRKFKQLRRLSNPNPLHQNSLLHKMDSPDDIFRCTFSVPTYLATSGYDHTPIITFLHMCAPGSTILLHQEAEEQASICGFTPSLLKGSQVLRVAAAEMIVKSLASHANTQDLHPFTCSILFPAVRFLMQSLNVRTNERQQQLLGVLLGALYKLEVINPRAGGYFKYIDARFPGMRQAIFQQVHDSTSTPPITTPEISEFPPVDDVVHDQYMMSNHTQDLKVYYNMREDRMSQGPEEGEISYKFDLPQFTGIVMEDNIPMKTMEGDVVRLSGVYYGTPVKMISINVTEVAQNSVKTFNCELTRNSELIQSFHAELYAVRGKHYVTILPFFEGPSIATMHFLLEVISRAEKAIQIYNNICGGHQSIKIEPDIELGRYAFPDDVLRHINDLVAVEAICISVSNHINLPLNSGVRQLMLQLFDILIEQHKQCYLILPHNESLFTHLTARLWKTGIEPFFKVTQPSYTLVAKTESSLEEFRTTVPVLKKEWESISEKFEQLKQSAQRGELHMNFN